MLTRKQEVEGFSLVVIFVNSTLSSWFLTKDNVINWLTGLKLLIIICRAVTDNLKKKWYCGETRTGFCFVSRSRGRFWLNATRKIEIIKAGESFIAPFRQKPKQSTRVCELLLRYRAYGRGRLFSYRERFPWSHKHGVWLAIRAINRRVVPLLRVSIITEIWRW